MNHKNYKSLNKILLEKFGNDIGDNEGVPTSSQSKDMKNRGFGSNLTENITCEACGGMLNCDEDTCTECGMMSTKVSEQDLNQVAPPGMEKVVKALKKKGDVENPWAVAWSMYNKKKNK